MDMAHGVALMAGKDFPVRRCDDGKQKTEPGQGKPHQRKAFRIGAAGIVARGLQAFDMHKLYSAQPILYNDGSPASLPLRHPDPPMPENAPLPVGASAPLRSRQGSLG